MKIWKRDYYEKLFANKKPTQTVHDYQQEIQEAQKKIEELQSRCSHRTYEVVMYSWRPGAMYPSHVCSQCNQYLGDATEEESKKLWYKFHGNQGAQTPSDAEIFVDLTPTIKKRD